ncbi:MAG: dihydropteroate synthase [Pseudomonadota bacterium]
MLIVAERINASRRAIRAALEAQDADAVQREVAAQAAAGADYIDVNGGTFPGREAELLTWLVDVVQEATPLPLCLDCPDPAALAAALPRVKAPRPMINSINLEGDRFERMLPLVREFDAKVVALAQGQGVPPATAEAKLALASRLVEGLAAGGVALDDIYVDPLVFPVGVDPQSALATIDAVGEVMRRYPGVHTICGLTNVSHGLPARALVNRTFLVAAMGRGLDAAIIDPTDAQLMTALRAAEAILGRDEYCMAFIEEFQAGRIAA